MQIKKLILYKYKRFFLNNIDKVEYTPIERVQIIASRNGAGKSSLLRELNPLPADLKKDYKETGYKYIEIDYNNNSYILSSGYNGNNKHSFVFNNVELNDGGTKKVQLELVKEHFNITPAIIDILLNVDKLTNMSPSTRKHWFSELSTIDYTYSLNMYNKLKQRHRDIVGGIKLLQDSIIKYKLDIISEDKLIKLETNRDYLEQYIMHIVSLYDHTARSSDNNTVLEDIKLTTNSIKYMLYNILNIPNRDIITSNISKYEYDIKYHTDLITKYSKELELLDKLNNNDITDINTKLDTITKEITSIESSVYIDGIISNISNIHDTYSNVYSNIISELSILGEYQSVRHIHGELYKVEYNKLLELETIVRSINKKIDLLKIDIDHIEKLVIDDNKIVCNNCNHSWYHNYDETTVTKLKLELTNLTKEYDKQNSLYNIQKTLISKCDSKNSIILNIKNILTSDSSLNKLTHYILNTINIHTSTISEIVTIIDTLMLDINNWYKLVNLYNNRDDILKNISYINKVNELGVDIKTTKISDIEQLLNNSIIKKNESINLLTVNRNNLNMLSKLESEYLKLRKLLSNIQTGYNTNLLLQRNKYLVELSNLLKGELVSIDQIINSSKQYIGRYNKDMKLLDEYKSIEKVLSLAIIELSPSEGLIAKSINSFLNVFISEMNSVISTIWTYDMEILGCDIADNDLDYKFKIKVNNDEIIEDVSRLSSSMQEIVNLAFRIVFSKYMGILHMPLYLDEFGATFDKTHRILAYGVIDKIMSSDYDQVFMVSHYETLYGSMRNVNINVLDNNNIDMEDTISYNEVFKISYI